MAITTVDSSDLRFGSIPVVDLRFLSQSELNSLSLCSDHAFDPRRSGDIVVPKIDRSVFNESAGSRKQTYSRLRLAPRNSEKISTVGRRRHIPVSPQPSDSPERRENKRIVTLLRDLFSKDNSSNNQTLTLTATATGGNGNPLLESKNVGYGIGMEIVPAKRRGRKKGYSRWKNENENESSPAIDDNEIENRNGIPVDAVALGNRQDLFGMELRRRSEGLETESELLGFLNGLEGQWGSRRKKRKIVNADDFGDELPKGWKILLGIKRKEGRVWLYCRRYISPSGQQFVSCKEVSSYLLSLIGHQDARQPISGHNDESRALVTHKLATGSGNTFPNSSRPIQFHPSDLWVMQQAASLNRKGDITREVPVCYSALPISSLCAVPFASFSAVPISSFSADHEKKVLLFRVENPAKVQVQNILECHKCSLVFGDKESYVQHLLSFHPRNPKRCRLGKSIGNGVIIKDGKYECQFCHKIFDERHRYNGHVGVHVRNYVKSLEATPDEITELNSIDPSPLDEAPLMICDMDASVDIVKDKNSIPVISPVKSNDELSAGSAHSKQDMERETGDSPMCDPLEITHGILASNSVDEQDSDSEMNDDKLGNIVETSNSVGANINPCLTTPSLKAAPDEITVRNSTDPISLDGTPLMICDMDASVDIVNDKNSIPVISPVKSNDEQSTGSPHSKQDMECKIGDSPMCDPLEITCGVLAEQDNGSEMNDCKLGNIVESSNSVGVNINPCLDAATPLASNEEYITFGSFNEENLYSRAMLEDIDKSSNEQGRGSEKEMDFEKSVDKLELEFESCLMTLPDNEQRCGVETYGNNIFNCSTKEPKRNEKEESSNELENDSEGINPGSDKDAVMEIIGSAEEEIVEANVVHDALSLLVPSSGSLFTLNVASDMEEDKFSSVSQNLENISGFEELRFDDIEPSKFCFVSGQDSSPLAEAPMDMTYELNPSSQFEWDTVLPNMVFTHQLTTLCVWCRSEFHHDGVNPETQSDSVGFMCPTCKLKISGQLNVLDNGLSGSSQRL
ncbi:uncharacterized protein LOC143848470 [Tasmannia lanceolata]|uniref:uncharacterized protein LOC143848470 n=1 Tax=Tasmannia lanceolata TaxID=3420 RepID=UPI004062ADDE